MFDGRRFLVVIAAAVLLAACAGESRLDGTGAGAAPTSAAVPATTADAPRAEALTDYPDQPAGVPFPTAEWPVGELAPDVSRLALDRAAAAAFGPDEATQRVQSIVVVQGGAIVYERYHSSVPPDQRFHSFSVAKSFTSALVGLAVDDGVLSEDETGLRREWSRDDRADIELRDLLQMSSGLEWNEDYTAPSDVVQMINSRNAAAFVAARPLESAPGTEFEYSTGTTALLVGLVADRVGGCASATQLLEDRLFAPLGITSAELLRDDRGCWLGGLGANMTTRDFARFGLLYLRGGEWDGARILPAEWIDASRTPASTNSGYGYQWWLTGDGDAFAARGLLGQLILVVPSMDVVIAVNSSGGDPDTLANAVLAELRTPTGPDPAVTLPPTN